MTWQETVRSWGRTPLVGDVYCKGAWALGSACGRCKRCATASDRPPNGADLDELRRQRIAEQSRPEVEIVEVGPPASLSERLAAHAARMQSEDPLPNLPAWITGAIGLLREASDALTPKPWPPPKGWDECLAQDSVGDWHHAYISGMNGPEWFYETRDGRGEPCEGDARRYLPAPDPEPEGGAEAAPDEPILSLDLAVRSHNALERYGITTVRRLLQHSAEDLLSLGGIGPATVADIEAVLARSGLRLAEGGGE